MTDTKAVAEVIAEYERLDRKDLEDPEEILPDEALNRGYAQGRAQRYLLDNIDVLLIAARECEALREHADTLDAYKAVGCTPAAMAELRASLAAREGEVSAYHTILKQHANLVSATPPPGVNHHTWQDNVERLASILAALEPTALAIEQRIRDEGIELAGKALDGVKASAPDGVTKLYLHTLALKVRALKGTK